MKLKVSKRLQISVQDWDKLVEETYGKPYMFQQQDGCQERGIFTIEIPMNYTKEDEIVDMDWRIQGFKTEGLDFMKKGNLQINYRLSILEGIKRFIDTKLKRTKS